MYLLLKKSLLMRNLFLIAKKHTLKYIPFTALLGIYKSVSHGLLVAELKQK